MSLCKDDPEDGAPRKRTDGAAGAKVLPFVRPAVPAPKPPTLLDRLERQLFDDSDP